MDLEKVNLPENHPFAMKKKVGHTGMCLSSMLL